MVFDLERGVSNKLAVLGCQNISLLPMYMVNWQEFYHQHYVQMQLLAAAINTALWDETSGGAHAEINITAKKILYTSSYSSVKVINPQCEKSFQPECISSL